MLDKIRLYASLSEPRPVWNMDFRIVRACAALAMIALILLVVSVLFVHSLIGCVIALALGFGAWELARIGRSVWRTNPWAIDEGWAHFNTPVRGEAD